MASFRRTAADSDSGDYGCSEFHFFLQISSYGEFSVPNFVLWEENFRQKDVKV